MGKTKAPFSKKQLKILSFANTEYDALICDGAVRSGKTSIMSIAFVMWAMRDFHDCNFGICSKTVGTAYKNILKPLLSNAYMKRHYGMTFKKSDGELVVKSGDRTNTFYIYGGKDESSYELIQGVTLAGVLLDEVALMPRSFVEQALARCSVEGRKFWFNCNPEGQLHWFYKEWILEAEKHNALRLHFLMRDNPSLSEKLIRDYENMYTGVFFQRYILGLWVAAEGLIYDMFSDEVNILETLPETEGEYYVSSDYGIQNATTFLLWRKMRGSNTWICLREYYYSGREERKQKTVTELVEGMKGMLNGIRPKQVIVDPSAAALIVELRKEGYTVRAADNDVLDGISDVGLMLKNGNLKVMKDCKETIGEFKTYVWDGKAAKHGEDRPVKENDHCMDAVRYFVRTLKLVKKDRKSTEMYSSDSSGSYLM